MVVSHIIDIVELGPEEASELSNFISSAWKEAGPESPGWTGATEETIHDLTSEKYLVQILGDPKMKIFLAEDNGRSIGFAANRKIDDDVIELTGIIVIQDMLGRGCGSALLERSKNWAIEHGFKRMIVKTEQNNKRAISFYVSNGFAESAKKTEDILGTKVDIVGLELRLKS